MIDAVREIWKAQRAGIAHPITTWINSRKVGLPYWMACAFVSQEAVRGRWRDVTDYTMISHWLNRGSTVREAAVLFGNYHYEDGEQYATEMMKRFEQWKLILGCYRAREMAR